VKTLDKQLTELPEMKLDHLYRMTDSTGIFQHAIMAVPNFTTGYCADDNARALILTVLLEELGRIPLVSPWPPHLRRLPPIRLQPEEKRFRNVMEFNRSWRKEPISEDCCGRALLALGTCVGRSQNTGFQALAGPIFAQALAPVTEFHSPRPGRWP